MRADNPAVPAASQGTVERNSRVYTGEPDAYSVGLDVVGLDGRITFELAGERLTLDRDGLHPFKSTFVAGTEVTPLVATQPPLQSCSLTPQAATVVGDAAVTFAVTCADDPEPGPPFVTLLYSGAPDSVHVEWLAAADRDTDPGDLTYRVYYGLDKAMVEAKTASFVTTGAGETAADLSSLGGGMAYHIAVEAIDSDGNVSAVETRTISTVSSAPVFTGTPFHVVEEADVTVVGSDWLVDESLLTNLQVGDVLIGLFDDETAIVAVDTITAEPPNQRQAVSATTAAAVVTSMSIASEIASSEPPSPLLAAAATPASGVTKTLAGRPPVQASSILPTLCRTTETELTAEELAQITITPIRSPAGA